MEKETLKNIIRAVIAIFLITINEAIQRMATSALQFNMLLYLVDNFQMNDDDAANVVFVYKTVTTLMSLFIAFFSDSCSGRFSTIGVGSLFTTLGIFLLWSATMPQESMPNPCPMSFSSTQDCESQTPEDRRNFLFFCLGLISVGVSGVRCSVAFAADQLDNFSQNRVLEKFFSFYHASSSIPDVLAFTATTHLVEAYGWKECLRFPLIPLVLCVIVFFMASPLYVKEKPKRNLFFSFLQVAIAAIRNRDLSFPPPGTTGCYHSDQNSEIEVPSESLRFLNKACLVRNRERDIAPDGSAENSWKLCSVEQVEELKKLIKVLPFWSAGIVLWMNASQGTFMSLQAGSMERHLISPTFEIPVAVIGALSFATMIIWMIFYGLLILPLVSMFKGEPVQLGTKTRMGIGLCLSLLAMVISTVVERIRQGKIQEINAGMLMSAWWLLPQYGLIGISLAFAAVAQMEFLFTELPAIMWSIAADLLEKGTTLASFLSSKIADVILDLTSRKGQPKLWNDTKAAPFGDFYLVLALISFISLFCYGYWYWWHGPRKQESENNDDQ